MSTLCFPVHLKKKKRSTSMMLPPYVSQWRLCEMLCCSGGHMVFSMLTKKQQQQKKTFGLNWPNHLLLHVCCVLHMVWGKNGNWTSCSFYSTIHFFLLYFYSVVYCVTSEDNWLIGVYLWHPIEGVGQKCIPEMFISSLSLHALFYFHYIISQ